MTLLPKLEQKSTRIAYYDPFGVFGEIEQEFVSKLPLTNLHWNPPSRPLRSIPVLQVDLIREDNSESVPQHQMLGLSDSPYIKIMLVKCDDNDTYRSSVRQMIRDWVKSIIGLRDPTEWLILYYNSSPAPSTSKHSSGRSSFRHAVYDKIRADFNSGQKYDRCVQIFKNNLTDLETWNDFLTRIKEGVLKAFSERVELYEREVDKLEGKRDIMGWNVGTFFVMKEGLALSFENINLFEDALQIYDELEAAFSVSEKTFFSGVGFDDVTRVPQSILNFGTDRRDLRQSIASSEISLFEFHCYLFCQQALLLLYTAKASTVASISAIKVSELYGRLRSFITQMTAMLGSNGKNRYASAEWSYSIIAEILAVTESLVGADISEGRGYMLLLSIKALETLAQMYGWRVESFSDVMLDHHYGNSEAGSASEGYSVANTTLIRYLESEQSFYQAYRKITEDAIEQFNIAGRERTATQLKSQLALLDYQAKDYERAKKRLDNIPALYDEHGWDLVATSLLLVYVNCLEKLDSEKDLLLKHSLQLLRHQKHLSTAQLEHVNTKISSLIEDQPDEHTSIVRDTLKDFIKVEITAAVNQNLQGVFEIEATCNSLVKCDFSFSSAVLILENTQGMTLEFKSDTLSVTPRPSKIKFHTRSFAQGLFVLKSLSFIKNNLELHESYGQANPSRQEFILYQQPYGVWLEGTLGDEMTLAQRVIRIAGHMPPRTKVDCLELCIFDDRIKIADPRSLRGGKILNCETELRKFSTSEQNEQQLEGENPAVNTLPMNASSVSIIHLESESADQRYDVIVDVPFIAEFEISRLEMCITMKYSTPDIDNICHTIFETVNVGLAMDVRVGDFFKTSRLISKFSVGCKNELQPVLVESVSLNECRNFRTNAVYAQKDLVAMPGDSLSYIFTIDKLDNSTGQNSLELRIRYRYIFDALVGEELAMRLEQSKLEVYSVLLRELLRNVSFDVLAYARSRQIVVPEDTVDMILQRPEFGLASNDEKARLTDILNGIFFAKKENTYLKDAIDGSLAHPITRDLVLDVAIPDAHVVHGVELFLPEEDYFTIGQTIEAKLTITSLLCWTQEELPITEFIYEIVAPHDSWAITGKKRSKFVLRSSGDGKVGDINQAMEQNPIKLSLVPLKQGRLLLPRIDIVPSAQDKALAANLKMEIDNKNGQQSVLVMSKSDRLTVTF